MTMPHLMNCEHSPDGWCLSCVDKMHDDLSRYQLEATVYRQLLPVAKELRDALAGAMRVIVNYGGAEVVRRFEAEMERSGIKPGIGVRADAAIANADHRTQFEVHVMGRKVGTITPKD